MAVDAQSKHIKCLSQIFWSVLFFALENVKYENLHTALFGESQCSAIYPLSTVTDCSTVCLIPFLSGQVLCNKPKQRMHLWFVWHRKAENVWPKGNCLYLLYSFKCLVSSHRPKICGPGELCELKIAWQVWIYLCCLLALRQTSDRSRMLIYCRLQMTLCGA